MPEYTTRRLVALTTVEEVTLPCDDTCAPCIAGDHDDCGMECHSEDDIADEAFYSARGYFMDIDADQWWDHVTVTRIIEEATQ